ncbi:hypothetical protein C5E45_10235 [Nocardia nova]|uniref:Secreted protein n=1 Tax=Nocardia nova TaxID=37330 RepID=A0A2S6ASB4_9NOCA|nr:hypothetical protein C5E41_10300 [Nocardia nova]PPJ38141.1 hypothetical protein C5E45_10235 [Nocardia nova]
MARSGAGPTVIAMRSATVAVAFGSAAALMAARASPRSVHGRTISSAIVLPPLPSKPTVQCGRCRQPVLNALGAVDHSPRL